MIGVAATMANSVRRRTIKLLEKFIAMLFLGFRGLWIPLGTADGVLGARCQSVLGVYCLLGVSCKCAEQLLSGKHCLADAKPLVRWHNLLYPQACTSYQARRT